jgi:hypothetical protein
MSAPLIVTIGALALDGDPLPPRSAPFFELAALSQLI